MTWRVVFAPSAAASTKKLPPDIKRSVEAAIDSIALSPDVGKALVRELLGLYSYPMRRYRIVYALDSADRCVPIIAVGHRSSIYQELTKSQSTGKSR